MKIIDGIRGKFKSVKTSIDKFVDDFNAQTELNEWYKEYLKNNPPPPTIKELMNQETKWNLLKIVAMEDLYTVRHLKGEKFGIECYAVMIGGTVLSVHFDIKEALENWNARLNGQSAVNNDTWEIDDFKD